MTRFSASLPYIIYISRSTFLNNQITKNQDIDFFAKTFESKLVLPNDKNYCGQSFLINGIRYIEFFFMSYKIYIIKTSHIPMMRV